MKKTLLVLLTLLVVCTACGFLDEKPKDFLAPSNFYQTDADAVAAINAVYNQLYYHPSAMWRLGDLASDLLREGPVPRPENIELETYTFTSTNPYLSNLWREAYSSVNYANTAIERIPPIPMDEAKKARLIGEARFVRALNYFDLIKVFGAVPLVVAETRGLKGLAAGRVPVEQVYAQIVSDLTEAAQVLPLSYPASETGRATKGAAIALLSRVHLYQGNFAGAAAAAREVTGMGYGLLPSYAEVWSPARENSSEHVFSIQYKAGLIGSGFNETFGVRGAKAPITGFSSAYVRDAFYNSFASSDIRRNISIRNSYTFPDNSVANFPPHVWKFFNPNGITPSNTDTNWPVIRYAEVLLNLAEAINETEGPVAEAYRAVNEVRNRARAGALPEGLTREQFRDAVIQERAWELCFEGHRRFDLIRTGKLKVSMEKIGTPVILPKHTLYPIPLRELDINKSLEQNFDYN